jgi:hypothetical protein
MLCHVVLVRTDVSEELSASIIRITRIGERGAKFLRNVGSYESHTAYYPRRRHSSKSYYFILIAKSASRIIDRRIKERVV